MRPSISSMTASVIGFERSSSARSSQAASHLSIHAGVANAAGGPADMRAVMRHVSPGEAPTFSPPGLSSPMALDPSRTVAELRELQELTGDENGAQRVAWTETWERARGWLRDKVAETGGEESVDAAGNQWFTLGGRTDRTVLIGGHVDSVPNGGWLGGAVNVTARGEEVRRIPRDGEP